MKVKIILSTLLIFVCAVSIFIFQFAYCQDDDSTRNILKQGLLGAGTGAIAASASGGKAGQGALIGAGTNVIGGALLDAITGPSSSSRSSAPAYRYYDDSGGYYYEEEPPQESSTSKIIKQGLLGAGTGALASGMSGGDAGKGALIGAGTNVIGGALLDAITQPSRPKRVYYRPPAQQYQPQYQPQYQQPYQQQYQPQYQPQNVQIKEETVGSGDGRKKIIKKYDSSGKLISEEEIYY
ncbi:MAG: hypothetical protein NC938_00535 [Candidatus Omnitrophica bacterium]|nr:hypothetical protein [Candidatus Omnitrophota bacterium]MCM8790175.1 hypothetical protein [Candidatus Omnitrophota bacterium]